MPPCKLKTLVKTSFVARIILFQEFLEFKHVIIFLLQKVTIISAIRLCAKSSSLGNSPLGCCKYLRPEVQKCVSNQNLGY
jgi:hypothetical protein